MSDAEHALAVYRFLFVMASPGVVFGVIVMMPKRKSVLPCDGSPGSRLAKPAFTADSTGQQWPAYMYVAVEDAQATSQLELMSTITDRKFDFLYQNRF